jgi:hypothetical protein
MNYSRIANKFLNQNNNVIIQNTKQDRRKLSMKDFGDFWKDADKYFFDNIVITLGKIELIQLT